MWNMWNHPLYLRFKYIFTWVLEIRTFQWNIFCSSQILVWQKRPFSCKQKVWWSFNEGDFSGSRGDFCIHPSTTGKRKCVIPLTWVLTKKKCIMAFTIALTLSYHDLPSQHITTFPHLICSLAISVSLTH